ncbi:MAG: class I SAM-dependent methyltransferase [Rhodospirillaceae bacterium]|nr:class I SAM-dependent methyltransferase [Rhodospirillaceae bacterium]
MTSPKGLRARLIDAFMRDPPAGALTLHWPDGVVNEVAGPKSGPHAVVHLKRWRAVRRALMGGAMGLADGYIDGDWDSPDIAAVVEFGAYLQRAGHLRRRPTLPQRWLDRWRHRRNANTRSRARANIAAHYDLGNAFYALWLDETLTYSSAIFERPDQPLDEAQRNKCRRLLRQLAPAPGGTLLEIGCGWGQFACLAAKEAQLKVTAITLSREQLDFARRRVFAEGLAERVSVELCDYRDVSGRYDRIASIEMIEAVGEEYWPAFFGKLSDSLAPGGRAALQAITIDEGLFPRYRRGPDFIQKYIFPGGMLPSGEAMRREGERAGLAWIGAEGFGQHYADTLAAWRKRFTTAWDRVAALGFDGRFKRLWTFYLAYCEGGFRAGNIDVRHVAFAKP